MGKRKRRSRGFGSVVRRGDIYYIQYRPQPGAKRVRTAIGPFREIAEQKLRDIKRALDLEEHLGVREIQSITFEKFWDIIKKQRQAELKPRSFSSEKGHQTAIWGYFGARPLKEVRPAHVIDYLTHLRTKKPKGCSKATANRHRITLSVTFKAAVERGYAATNPVAAVKPFREEILPRVYLSPAEIDRVILCSQPDMRDVVTLAADSGLRREELVELEWRDIDSTAGKHGALVVRHSKSGRFRHVPLTERCQRMLKAREAERRPTPNSERVFPEFAGWRVDRITKAFPAAAKRAGKKFSKLRFHDLRHAYASGLVRSGVPIPIVAKLLGHAPASLNVTLRYAAHAPDGAEFDAVELFERVRDEAERKRKEQAERDQRGGGAAGAAQAQ